jgi:FKBP-type peptidyl-prolyl cis-trans isomerase FklB
MLANLLNHPNRGRTIMEKLLKVLSVVSCAALLAGAAWASPDAMTDQQKRSYAVGASMGNGLRQQGLDFDPELIAKGLIEAMNGKSQLADEEIAAIIRQLREEVKQKQETERQRMAAENLQRGTAFLAEYARQEGVRSLPGGVLYRVLQAGAGEKATGAEFVMCHYRGRLINGKEFDASKPGKPATFTLDKVIAGWREALPEMPVGSKWELVIPAEKAYGERGAAPSIGPNETLIFEVELVGFE